MQFLCSCREAVPSSRPVTRLLPDGSGKAVFDDPDEDPKKMIGLSAGFPIILAPPTDMLGMAITEGIEDGLPIFEATGLGIWVSGSASRMPALADVVPDWIEEAEHKWSFACFCALLYPIVLRSLFRGCTGAESIFFYIGKAQDAQAGDRQRYGTVGASAVARSDIFTDRGLGDSRRVRRNRGDQS